MGHGGQQSADEPRVHAQQHDGLDGGANGAIRSTTNGASWSLPVYPTTQELYAVWAADANNAWAVGFNGTILKWNGGTWSAQTSGTTNNLYGVWGASTGKVWAVGLNGTILKWSGISWSAQTSNTTGDLRDIWGADSSNIWAVGFGVLPGAVISRDFIIRNDGLANLAGLGVTIDGADFTVTAGPAAPLSFSDGTTFTVRFAPTGTGPKNAALHIASNVSGSNSSFDIALTGTGFTQCDNWRETYFPGSTATTGPGADLATPQNDGVTNLIKFATGMDPTAPGLAPGSASIAENSILFTYTRNKTAAGAGIAFVVEWSDTPAAGSWSSAGVTESVVDQGATELVTATVPKSSGDHRWVHLRVTMS